MRQLYNNVHDQHNLKWMKKNIATDIEWSGKYDREQRLFPQRFVCCEQTQSFCSWISIKKNEMELEENKENPTPICN